MIDIRFAGQVVYLRNADGSDRILGTVERGKQAIWHPCCGLCHIFVGPGDHSHRTRQQAAQSLVVHHQHLHALKEEVA